jgi:hypothetical protein
MEIDLSGIVVFAIIGVLAVIGGAGWLAWTLIERLI